MTFTVKNYQHRKLSLTNLFFHNPQDFNNKSCVYVKINNTYLYISIADSTIKPGCISISSPIKYKLGIQYNQNILLEEYIPVGNLLMDIIIHISLFGIKKSDNELILHENVIKDAIKTYFNKCCFSGTQYLFLIIDGVNFIIKTTTKKEGYMTFGTSIMLVSDDVLLNIIK
jgi:hypothetical protein